MKWLLCVAAAVNLYAFCLMGADKARAKRKRWRISEKRLLLTAACFGALGGCVGMYVFRHKTRHARFRYGMPAMLLAQLVIAAAMIWRTGWHV